MRVTHNKFVIIRNDGLVTGLVAAETPEEAEADAAAMGLTGTILTTEDYELTPQFATQQLQEKRTEKIVEVLVTADPFDPEIKYIADSALETAGLSRKALANYVENKLTEIASMDDAQLDAYDPKTDPSLKV